MESQFEEFDEVNLAILEELEFIDAEKRAINENELVYGNGMFFL